MIDGNVFCSQLNKNLERCMAKVNKHLLRHKIILGLDDRGKISCHKVNLCFIFFDTSDCVVSLFICFLLFNVIFEMADFQQIHVDVIEEN
jgi:hypothetical protein